MSDAHLFWLSAVLNEMFEVQFDIIIQVALKQPEIIIQVDSKLAQFIT